jgi:uncharacterized membrane protein
MVLHARQNIGLTRIITSPTESLKNTALIAVFFLKKYKTNIHYLKFNFQSINSTTSII